MDDYVLEIKNLNLIYPNGYKALNNLSLKVPRGKRIAILGPNGAGKSSLVKTILGLEKAKYDKLKILGKDINKETIVDRIAYIAQRSEINSQFPTNVFDIVLMGRYANIKNFLKIPGKKDKDIAISALEKMKISDLKDRHISELSGGQAQRAFIARALTKEADIFIMDEPLAGVDIKTEEIIMNSLKEFQENNKTCIVIHHDLSSVSKYFDYVIWINKNVIAQGSVEQAFNEENYKKTYTAVDSKIFTFDKEVN
ncbi:metal ABC transporter ATP-binding protein [Gemella sp. zg-570]|uniref:metal ABC transporter ATP-binding protein n=1 Tax=Gemella sp. zg-570 TaxID=2840371 RepID=UPI001C0B0A50|nr:metal ABC transporter ATP-binding protein [Gemella sp. zg-570]QWQ38690.1 metal ABC transporter ATP-binding protein [Gemella sp. zg-570]